MNRKHAYWLEQVAACPALLAAAVKLVEPNEMVFKPASADWSIHQILSHLVQVQRDRFVLIISLALNKPGSPIHAFDADAMMAAHHDPSINSAKLLLQFKQASGLIVAMMQASAPGDWDKPVVHPRLGPLPVTFWVAHAYGHTHEHISQIINNRDHWLRK